MRHHIVAHLVLALFGDLVVDVGDVRGELVDLLLRDGQAQLVLGAASATHSLRHVWKRISGEKRCSMYSDA